jgi:hypothetical protein
MAPKKSIFRVVINGDMDNSIPITGAEDFPDELGEYRESIFAQLSGTDYYTSQLVLKRGDDFITYDFYSDRAWLDEVKWQAVQPYEEREREQARILEREQWKQEGMREAREAKGAEFSFLYHVVDRETGLPIYVGRSVDVERRIQQHLNSARSLSGIPKLYGYLGKLIEEERDLPTVRVVGKTARAFADREEQAEIFRLIREGVPLFNKEYVRATTRARALMNVQFPIEWFEGGR